MEIGSILLALALVLLVVAFVARPFLEKALPQGEVGRASDLVTQREAILTELRDLDFDHTTGKLAEDDYQSQRTRLMAKGAEILRAIDQLPSAVEPSRVPDSMDAEIELRIAKRRQAVTGEAKAKSQCPNCHKPIQASDNFCPSCGAKLD
jgi:zinc-ribbon domain